MGKKQKKTVGCDPRICGIEVTVKEVFREFKEIAGKLTENQTSMQLQIQKLSDNIGVIGKVEKRMEKIEDKVDKNSMMMYKVVGVAMAFAAATPFLVGLL